MPDTHPSEPRWLAPLAVAPLQLLAVVELDELSAICADSISPSANRFGRA
jgi:hypothetical protein